jgi:FAD/FMN-containing dehydrogenase
LNAALDAHAARSAALAEALRGGRGPAGLAKETSNLFRDRAPGARRRLDVSAFRNVLAVDREQGFVEAEGMVTYEDLVEACLPHGVMPAVVPQLKTITLGGAVAGVGIESTSHARGLVHETVREIEVLTGDGRVVACTRHNEHSDLFFGFPNSYGTLGYALRVKADATPVRAFVHLQHRAFPTPVELFTALERHCEAGDAHFIDGVVFARDRLYLTLGRFVDEAPFTSDYTYERIYYRSIAEKREDYLTTRDYLWRWDTDWFWCSKNVFAQNPLVRRLYGRKRLGSRTYGKIMRWNARTGLSRALSRVAGLHSESVIQDVDIPIEHAAGFLGFFLREVGILPVWICPIGPGPEAGRFPLYAMGGGRHVNFGFWDVVRGRQRHPPGHFNRLIEREVARLGGIKSLYSESFYSPDEFAAAYGGEVYRQLKARYDPGGVFPTLYDKCVLRR